MKKLLDYFVSLWRRLLELRDTPHAIAGGVAIGVFFGFSPLFGVKTLLSLGTAWLTRCSKIAAVIAVSLHDVVWPFLPFLLRIQYDIGYWILSNPHTLPPKMVLHEVKLHAVLHWETVVKSVKWLCSYHGGLPLLIGAFVMAIPAALVAYVITYGIMRKRHLAPLRPSS
ncbi:MAG TPA: DUF2062 domain-containing protein [Chthoniobacterales bacterium]|nr:DUF2062 domain-containing protein [Chthoniobacterales bacterium]